MDKKTKYAISIIFDLLDFFIGRIPGFGTIFDAIGGFIAIKIWGPIGSIQFLEVIDVTDQFDSFIPTMTIVGLISEVKIK